MNELIDTTVQISPIGGKTARNKMTTVPGRKKKNPKLERYTHAHKTKLKCKGILGDRKAWTEEHTIGLLPVDQILRSGSKFYDSEGLTKIDVVKGTQSYTGNLKGRDIY